MLKRRLVPVLFLQHGWMVRSERFRVHQVIGNPVVHVERMTEWDVDELIVIDISKGDESNFDHHRDDYREHGTKDLLGFIRKIASECRIPLSFGGRIRTLADIGLRIQNGADKVAINTAAWDTPALIGDAAKEFGGQAVIVSIDYRTIDGRARVVLGHGETPTDRDPAELAAEVADRGAGEIFLSAVDRDGTAKGYDLETIDRVASSVNIPVIACGGAGHQRHFLECFSKTPASAVAAGNIFHFTENAYPRAKAFLRGHRDDIR